MDKRRREVLLGTSRLTKDYGRQRVLDEVSLSVERGQVYGLVGRNGAGKSTLFKLVCGLARPTSGTVELFGCTQPHDLALARRRIGTALTPVFYPYLSAAENLLTLAPLKGLRGSLAQSSTEELLQEVGLADVRKPFKQFSLGMKQRLNIAAALLGQPELVILDEPINGLDPKGIIEIRRLIRRYAREQGITFIISSHILSELDAVATCFGFLEQGVLLEELTREQLHAKTSSLEDYFLRLIGIEDEDEEGTGRMNGGHA